jgi:hypothetical protein
MTEPADRLMPFLIAVLIPFLTVGGIPDPDLARIRALTNIASMLGNGEAPRSKPACSAAPPCEAKATPNIDRATRPANADAQSVR